MLEILSALNAPCGGEEQIEKYIKTKLKDAYEDNLGNLVFRKKGGEKKLMLFCALDEDAIVVMSKKDVKLDGQRVRFSKKIKRDILLEVAKGTKVKDAFLKYAFISLEGITKDKKYAAKLLYKWKQELYENKEVLNLLNHNVDEKMIEEEINSIGNDEEEDIVFDDAVNELKRNFLKII